MEIDPEYADDDELLNGDDPFNEEFGDEPKPEPMSFPDAYSPAKVKPVELVVPRHAEAFKAIAETEERRFPAKRVARSAIALARALKAETK